MRIIFACGGTAGHINPALAVAGRIKELMPDSSCSSAPLARWSPILFRAQVIR